MRALKILSDEVRGALDMLPQQLQWPHPGVAIVDLLSRLRETLVVKGRPQAQVQAPSTIQRYARLIEDRSSDLPDELLPELTFAVREWVVSEINKTLGENTLRINQDHVVSAVKAA